MPCDAGRHGLGPAEPPTGWRDSTERRALRQPGWTQEFRKSNGLDPPALACAASKVSSSKREILDRPGVPVLLVHRGPAGVRHRLDGDGPWIVGRAEDCEIQILDPMVSRHHLRIERDGLKLRFRDLGGTNPTLVRGRIQRQGELVPGMALTLGGTRAELVIADQAPEVEVSPDSDTAVREREQLAQESSEGEPLSASVLIPLLRDEESASGVSSVALRAVLQALQHEEGLIAEFAPETDPRVLASARLGGEPAPLQVGERLFDEFAGCEQATILRRDTDDVLLLPLGGSPPAGMLLTKPKPHAPPGQSLLAQGRLLAELIGARLAEVRRREALEAELGRMREALHPGHEMLLASRRLHETRHAITAAAQHMLPVYFVAPDGTERELLARSLHAQSELADGPFVPFFCSMVPTHRADEELFGASQRQRLLPLGARGPALLRANRGTLFLDSPELLPIAVQDRLAQALSRGNLLVPGASAALPLELRLVVAAEQVPSEMTADGPHLRPALAELLTGIRIDVPALRDHPDDILALAELVLRKLGPGHGETPRQLTGPAQQLLVAYTWPGNLRELQRVVQNAAALAGQEPIAPRHLPPEIREHEPGADLRFDTLAGNERQYILRVLTAVGGNRRRAAKLLGIAVSTLYDKLKRLPQE